MAVDDQDRAPVIRLDDDFVRSATFKEGSADERRRTSERQQRRADQQRARKIRRQWRPRRRLNPKGWVIPALTVVAALYILKLGPFKPASRPQLRSAGITSPTTLAPGETTSTTYTLERLTYRPGDCVKWDQRKDGPGSRDTDIVPCDQPHLIEITGRTVAPDAPAYPPESEWDRVVQSGECAAQAKAYVGVLDPYGRFGIGAIRPSRESWNAGDREIWCGLQTQSQAADHDPEISDLFTGKVQSQPQAMLWPTGSCLGGQEGTRAIEGTVSCTTAHIYEIVGTVNAAARFTSPPPASSPLWHTRLGNDCDKVARTRFGGRLPAGVQISIFPVDPASWAAGRRTTECAVARFDVNDQPITLTAPLALQQKAVSG